MEQTFIMIKPDGVKRGLVGDILKRFEQKGYTLKRASLLAFTREQAQNHYIEHQSKPFYGELVDYLTSGDVFAMVWEGENIVATSRAMIGSTFNAAPGTIRGDFVFNPNENVIHGSDSVESAVREIKNAFDHV